MKTLVIIPAYNEQETILNVVQMLKTACPNVDHVVVNDCSSDSTETICKENNINHISLPINLGIGGSVQTGYRYATAHNYDITVQLDGDGQHDPSYIKQLIQPIIDGKADMVIGSRFLEKSGFQSSASRRAGIRFLSGLIRLCCGSKVQDVTSGFRACNKRVTTLFASHYAQDYPEPEAIIDAVKNKFRVMETPVIMQERQGGITSIHALRSIYYMIKVSLAILMYCLKDKNDA